MLETLAVKVVCAALLLGACTRADLVHVDRLTTATAVILTACDAGQMSYAARRPYRFEETNPMLGAHPSQGAVALYFGAVIGATVASAIVLPRWAVPVVDAAIASICVSSLWHNTATGEVPITCGIQGDRVP